MHDLILCETLYQDASLAHRVRFYALPSGEVSFEYVLLDSKGTRMHTFVASQHEHLDAAIDALAFEDKVMPWLYKKVMDDLEKSRSG
ncbi:MAG: hypothetical protein U0Z75_08380 [Deinococcaceae bacterium]